MISSTAALLNQRLPDDLSADIEEHVHIDFDDDVRQARKSDVYVIEQPLTRPMAGGPVEGSAALIAAPIILPDPGPFTERSLQIVDHNDNRIITAIEILSPWNKRPVPGRDEYLRKRREVLASNTNLVEVDLVRTGQWVEMTSPYAVPPEHRTVYRVTVYPRPGDARWFPIPLSSRLSAFEVPLRDGVPSSSWIYRRSSARPSSVGRGGGSITRWSVSPR